MTRDKLISDIELRLTKSKPSDDLELERRLISHWLDIVRDSLVSETLVRDIKAGKGVNPYYIQRETCVATNLEENACDDYDRYYVTLTNTPLNLPKGKGIVKVQLTDNTPILPTTIEYLDVMEQLPYASPSEDRPLYYRINTVAEADRLYIVGFEENTILNEKVNIFYVSSYANSTNAEDDEFLIADELVPFLLDEVEQIARRERGSEEDLENDGIQ